MSKWDLVQLGDVCVILDNMRVPITASERKKGIYPYYGANGIQDYVDDFIFDDELVLLAEDGGNFGSKDRPIAYRVSGKCWVNNHAHVLKPKSMLDVDYLCYSIMFYDVSKLINGTTRAKLNQAAMRKMIIPLPPLPVQQKIADVLDRASVLIEKRKSQIAMLDLLVKSRFVEMFGDPVRNPMGWEVRALGELCNKITDGKHGGCVVEVGSGFFFVGAREISNGEIHYETAPEITPKDFHESYKRCNLEIGDLVIVNTGATIGKNAMAKDLRTNNTLLQKSVALLKANKQLILPIFLQYCYITNPSMYRVESASAQPNLLLSKIRVTEIYVPPLHLQTQFSDFVRAVDKSKAEMQSELERLELLYKSLMQKCFNGEMF